MTDATHPNPAQRPAPGTTALATLELAARRELVQLAAALPANAPAADPLLAHVAWDLGLTGNDLAGKLAG